MTKLESNKMDKAIVEAKTAVEDARRMHKSTMGAGYRVSFHKTNLKKIIEKDPTDQRAKDLYNKHF